LEFGADRVGYAVDRVLRGAVYARVRACSSDAGDIDDMPLCPLLPHGADRSLATGEQAKDVRLEHLAPPLGIRIDDRSWIRHAGVIHHDVESARFASRALHQVLHLGNIANVGHHGRGLSAILLDARLRSLHRVWRAACQIDMSARARRDGGLDRKSTRLNSSHEWISYAVFCLK